MVLVEEVLQGKKENYKAELLERKHTVDCFTAGSGCSPALVPVWLPLWLLPLLAFSHTPEGQTPSMGLRSTPAKELSGLCECCFSFGQLAPGLSLCFQPPRVGLGIFYQQLPSPGTDMELPGE